MSDYISNYWDLAEASDQFGISKNSLTKWKLDAIDGGHTDIAQPDAVYGNTNLYHKNKWRKLIEIHYAEDILRLEKLGLIFTVETMEQAKANSYQEGYVNGRLDGIAEVKADPFPRAVEFSKVNREAIEPLDETRDVNEPLVEYATTKGPDFNKLTDGRGFQSIV
jgi:hypothetical protein